MSIAETLDMGKHAFYVWGAYGVTALFMILEVVLLMMKRRSMLQKIMHIVRMNRE